jgi:hypothetical protein
VIVLELDRFVNEVEFPTNAAMMRQLELHNRWWIR